MKKVLVVHGYEIDGEGNLEALAKATCDKVIKIQHRFTHIILLGGWHRKESPCTIGDAMRGYLEKRMPREKLYTRESLGCDKCLPPRDTMEEVDVVPKLLRKLGMNPLRDKFWVIGAWMFWPRLWILYWKRGAHARIIGAFSWETAVTWKMLKRMYWQLVGIMSLLKDPLGESPLIVNNRNNRTLDDPSKYVLNTPEAWKE
jgi:hypothetical protein